MSNNNHTIPWSKKHKKVTKAATGGLKFSLSNSFGQPPSLKELIEWSLERNDSSIVEQYHNHSLDYTPNGGSLDLRQAIADLYDDNISLDNILVFPGAQVALQTAARAICTPGSHAITFTPGYQSVQEGPIIAGASVTKIPLSRKNDWQIDIGAIEEAIQHNTRYIVLNEPYNPAGTLMSRQTQSELLELAKKHNIHVLCDEVYRLLEHNPHHRLPAMAECYELGLSVVTLSKPWGACGVTIGWIATQDRTLVERLSDLQYFGTACPSRSSEIQAIMVLRESDRILKRNLEIIKRNKTLLEQFMKEYSDLFTWVVPTAGAIAAIKFLGPLTSQELGSALAAAGIGIKPAYCFSENVTSDTDYFRVGFGESNVPAALDALRRFVQENENEWRKAMSKEGIECAVISDT